MFDADRHARTSALKICAIRRIGDLRVASKPDGPRNTTSMLTAVVSEAPWHDLIAQVHDAIAFLGRHRAELQALHAMSEVTDMVLDFPIERRHVFVQALHLPSELVTLAGELGLALELSLYQPADDGGHEPKDHEP